MSVQCETQLIRNSEVDGHPGLDVRLGPSRIEDVGAGLARRAGEPVLDAAGGAVIPGLHDHHVHLRALVAARQSADVSGAADPAAFDRLIAAAASSVADRAAADAARGRRAGQAGNRWLRATGWNEYRAGPLDRYRLDLLTGPEPARVQHRSGAMWVLNSAALRAVGAAECDQPGVERDDTGVPTGRLLRMDGWLRARLAAAGSGETGPTADNGEFAAGLAAYAQSCARQGVSGFTDATPGRDQADVDQLSQLSATGAVPQRLMLMAPPGLRQPESYRVTLGPLKIILDDRVMPSVAELAATIATAHDHGIAAALHCVTAEQLVVAVAAIEHAGPAAEQIGTPDRIEHAGVVPPGFAARMTRLGLAVVTQPGFISDRGDDYLRYVPRAEQDWLYPCASLLQSGVNVAAGTDAPFGPANPWQCIAAAVSRLTPEGQVLGAAERVGAQQALQLFLASPEDLRRRRGIAIGQPGDVCVLRKPLREALRHPAAASVRATIISGRVFAADGQQSADGESGVDGQ